MEAKLTDDLVHSIFSTLFLFFYCLDLFFPQKAAYVVRWTSTAAAKDSDTC